MHTARLAMPGSKARGRIEDVAVVVAPRDPVRNSEMDRGGEHHDWVIDSDQFGKKKFGLENMEEDLGFEDVLPLPLFVFSHWWIGGMMGGSVFLLGRAVHFPRLHLGSSIESSPI